MKRLLAAVLFLCGTSGCYTVLRHPAVERGTPAAYYDVDLLALGPMQDCAACHETWLGGEFEPWLPPYTPVWLAYNAGPWWERAGVEQTQSHALANKRPRPAFPSAAPVTIGVSPGGSATAVKPGPGRLVSAPVSSPHSGAAAAGTHAAPAGGRDADAAAAPHPAASGAAAQPPDPPTAAPAHAAAPAAAPRETPAPAQGHGLLNSRPRPS